MNKGGQRRVYYVRGRDEAVTMPDILWLYIVTYTSI